MSCGKCGKSGGCFKLCPFSFGLAVGLTCGFAVIFGALCARYFGGTGMLIAHHMPVLGSVDAGLLALYALLKGTVFGFFVALIYDAIISCCKCRLRCCKKSDEEVKCCTPVDKKLDAGK